MTRNVVPISLLLYVLLSSSSSSSEAFVTTAPSWYRQGQQQQQQRQQQQQQQQQQSRWSRRRGGAGRLAFAAKTRADLPEGLIKTVSKVGDGNPLKLGDIASVKYSCYVPPNENGGAGGDPTTTLPFARASQQQMVVGDGNMIDGFERALRTMRVGERSVVRVTDPSLAYGSAGFEPVVPPNAVVEMDIEVLQSQAATANIDFDSLASVADGRVPQTASEIAAAYESKQAAKMMMERQRRGEEAEKDPLEAFIEKAKNFYFFGLFEGETGERPPWFLRPSITFPLAFLIVGAAFYVSFVSGAITERGAQTKDELDEIILSMSDIMSNGMDLFPASVSVTVVVAAIMNILAASPIHLGL